jgi:hypothetical protein
MVRSGWSAVVRIMCTRPVATATASTGRICEPMEIEQWQIEMPLARTGWPSGKLVAASDRVRSKRDAYSNRPTVRYRKRSNNP